MQIANTLYRYKVTTAAMAHANYVITAGLRQKEIEQIWMQEQDVFVLALRIGKRR